MRKRIFTQRAGTLREYLFRGILKMIFQSSTTWISELLHVSDTLRATMKGETIDGFVQRLNVRIFSFIILKYFW